MRKRHCERAMMTIHACNERMNAQLVQTDKCAFICLFILIFGVTLVIRVFCFLFVLHVHSESWIHRLIDSYLLRLLNKGERENVIVCARGFASEVDGCFRGNW